MRFNNDRLLQAVHSTSTTVKISLAIFITVVDVSFDVDGTQQNAFPLRHTIRGISTARLSNDLMTHQTFLKMKSARRRRSESLVRVGLSWRLN
jgi:hypothetical protein